MCGTGRGICPRLGKDSQRVRPEAAACPAWPERYRGLDGRQEDAQAELGGHRWPLISSRPLLCASSSPAGFQADFRATFAKEMFPFGVHLWGTHL